MVVLDAKKLWKLKPYSFLMCDIEHEQRWLVQLRDGLLRVKKDAPLVLELKLGRKQIVIRHDTLQIFKTEHGRGEDIA